MTISLHPIHRSSVADLNTGPGPEEPEADLGSIEDLEGVRLVADALDRLRALCDRAGPATLIAQVSGVPNAEICAALEEITRTGETVLRDCLARRAPRLGGPLTGESFLTHAADSNIG